MTISEAVTYIEDIKNGLHETGKDFPYRDEVIPVAKEALDIAIKALEQEPCEDCVSREQLNKLYNKYRPFLATRVCEFGEKLKELPSVQPIATDNNVLTCEDAISRQAAIDCLNADFTIDGKENMETVVDYINGAFKQIKALPSVTPQPKMGQWINKYAEDACGERYSYWACSECGRDVGFNLANIEDVLSDYPYCHCGAKMVEPQESEDKE